MLEAAVLGVLLGVPVLAVVLWLLRSILSIERLGADYPRMQCS